MNKYIVFSVVVLSLAAAQFAVAQPAGAPAPSQPAWMSTPVKEMVDKARGAMKQVPLEEFKGAFDRKEDAVILDVRNPDEYAAAHIPGAVNIARGLLEFNIWTVVPDTNKKVYVYCRTGGRAALATKQLNELGYKNAVAVREGIRDWVKAGYPIKTAITDDDVVLTLSK